MGVGLKQGSRRLTTLPFPLAHSADNPVAGLDRPVENRKIVQNQVNDRGQMA